MHSALPWAVVSTLVILKETRTALGTPACGQRVTRILSLAAVSQPGGATGHPSGSASRRGCVTSGLAARISRSCVQLRDEGPAFIQRDIYICVAF